MTVGLAAVLYLAAALFCVGLFGAVSRKDPVGALVALALMAGGVGLNAVAMSRFVAATRTTGHVLALFVVVLAAAQVSLGLALAFRRRADGAGPRDEEAG